MSDLLKLAERCEQATVADRELDVRIEMACGPDGDRIRAIMAGSPHNTIDAVATAADREDAGVFFRVPNYTASLDAAMTLVPEGWDWSAGTDGEGGGHSFLMHGASKAEVVCDTATPALSLCAAALRARATA